MAESSTKPTPGDDTPNGDKPNGGDRPAAPVSGGYGRIGNVVIEISTPTCGNIVWPHPRMMLRGEWRRDAIIGISARPGLQKMPSIPGLRIAFNGASRSVKVYDPLASVENATLLAEIHRCYDELFLANATRGHAGGPEPERHYPDLSNDDLKTWLWWMRRHVDEGNAKLIAGNLPTSGEIRKLAGKTLVETFQSRETTRYLEDRRESVPA